MPSSGGSRPVKSQPEACFWRSQVTAFPVKPSPHPRLQVLSPVEIERHGAYEGPTWLDQAIISKWQPDASARGFAVEIDGALAARGRWLVAHRLAEATPARRHRAKAPT